MTMRSCAAIRTPRAVRHAAVVEAIEVRVGEGRCEEASRRSGPTSRGPLMGLPRINEKRRKSWG